MCPENRVPMYLYFGDGTSIAKYCIRPAGTLKLCRRIQVRPKARNIRTTYNAIVIFEAVFVFCVGSYSPRKLQQNVRRIVDVDHRQSAEDTQ
jgi:hypothetical protein